MKIIIVYFCLVSSCIAGPKFYSRNGQLRFRCEGTTTIRTYDSRGCFSGEYRKVGSGYIQTNSGFKQAKPNSNLGAK